MSDETNNPKPPGNRPSPPRPAPPPGGQGLAPWEIGQSQNQTPTPPTGAQTPRPAPSTQGLAPWEIGQGQNSQPSGGVYPSQSGARPPFQPNAQQGSYQPRPADNFQVSEPSDIGRKIGTVALAIGFLVLGWLIAYEFVPTNVYPPSGYVTFRSGDNRFAIDRPLGWSVSADPADSGSDSTIGTAFFRDGSGKIQVTSDTLGALKGNVLLNSSAALPPDFTANPADAEHDYQKHIVASTLKNYMEQPETTVPTHFGPALVSEFTGVGGLAGLGGPMHGYRASASDGSSVFEIVLQCPEKSWSAMSPSFMRIIQSIGPADGKPFVPPANSGSPMPGIPAIPGASTDQGSDATQ